jgi:hypothetical protein
MPMFFVMLLLAGLQHPTIAAGLGLLYTVGRFFYFKGYSTGVPDNRLKIGYVSLASSCNFLLFLIHSSYAPYIVNSDV